MQELLKNNEKFIKSVIKRFEPMSEEEQHILLFMLLTCYLECCDGAKNAETEEKKQGWIVQVETYDFIMNLFTKPLEEIRYNSRKVVLEIAKKEMEELFKIKEDA